MTDPQHEETFADTERKLREIITTLRAQLAEADELIEAQAKDHASNNIRLAETSYRADRAEAALAAQIEADAGVDPEKFLELVIYAAKEAREKALREAADELRGQGYGNAVRTILALIKKEKTE